eukprot:PhF_6_TR25584/c0_g1_i1/m.35867
MTTATTSSQNKFGILTPEEITQFVATPQPSTLPGQQQPSTTSEVPASLRRSPPPALRLEDTPLTSNTSFNARGGLAQLEARMSRDLDVPAGNYSPTHNSAVIEMSAVVAATAAPLVPVLASNPVRPLDPLHINPNQRQISDPIPPGGIPTPNTIIPPPHPHQSVGSSFSHANANTSFSTGGGGAKTHKSRRRTMNSVSFRKVRHSGFECPWNFRHWFLFTHVVGFQVVWWWMHGPYFNVFPIVSLPIIFSLVYGVLSVLAIVMFFLAGTIPTSIELTGGMSSGGVVTTPDQTTNNNNNGQQTGVCKICHTPTHPETRHCIQCGRCVLGKLYHSDWLSVCVTSHTLCPHVFGLICTFFLLSIQTAVGLYMFYYINYLRDDHQNNLNPNVFDDGSNGEHHDAYVWGLLSVGCYEGVVALIVLKNVFSALCTKDE